MVFGGGITAYILEFLVGNPYQVETLLESEP